MQVNKHEVISPIVNIPVVLIVDDVANNLLAFEGMLRRDDIEIVTASSGRAALDILLKRDVALAIVDVQMPDMDGFELASLMKGVEKTRYVPIVFVTADSSDQSRMFQGYDIGAVDYLYKPVDERVLCGKVAVFVTLERQRQELLRAEWLHEMFVGVLGHDLRNPLSGILMGAQALQRRANDVVADKTLKNIVDASERMARMIAQILDLTRTRLGAGLSLSTAPGNLRTVVEQIVEELAPHTHEVTIEAEGDTLGCWDIDRIAQVVSNLLGNALQHSPAQSPVTIRVNGNRQDTLELEVHNGGKAVPPDLRDVLFDPFRGGPRTSGLGLGLFICKQIVVGHGGTIDFESSDKAGTLFRVKLPRYVVQEEGQSSDDDRSGNDWASANGPAEAIQSQKRRHARLDRELEDQDRRRRNILVVDDDSAIRESLEILLCEYGYHIVSAADESEALEIVSGGRLQPDMIIVDYNLAKGVKGPEVVARLRQALGEELPALILTGESFSGRLKDIALANSARLAKPFDAEVIIQTIEGLLAPSQSSTVQRSVPPPRTAKSAEGPVIFVVDDDDGVRAGLRTLLEESGRRVEAFASCETFLDAYHPNQEACLLIDGYLPGMKGLELLRHLRESGYRLPAIMITGNGDIPMAVQAMGAGASDFLEKPVCRDDLLASIARALELARDSNKLPAWRKEAADRIASLTPRQRDIMERVLAGHPSKNIAADLGLSQRTVEAHRAATMKKTGTRCLPELVKLALAAAWNGGDAPFTQLNGQPAEKRAASG